jgi:beta-fructofuranosidase
LEGKRKVDYIEKISHATEALEKATSFADQDIHRLAYHIAAPANWINDPNGLVQFKGEYHVFYQHHPYSSEWGPMHWGHVKSKDLVHWNHLPIALAPGEEYDKGGVFSGSAVDDNGVLTLIYTGHVDGRNPKEVQCIATSTDGIQFEKFSENPVITSPSNDGSHDFRDPKVWNHENTWYMVVGSAKEGIGKALLYQSEDLRRWEYLGPLAESNGTQGDMWECPDLFPLDDKHVLIVSPMNMPNHKNVYMVGEMDYKDGKFTRQSFEELDYGFDFYAAQTFQDDQGRRILIGWMDMWGSKMPTQENGWAGALTIPRELSLLSDGKLIMKPVSELKALRKDHQRFQDVKVVEGLAQFLGNVHGDSLEIIAGFSLSECTADEFGLKVRCNPDGTEETVITFNRVNKELSVDRNKSGKGDGGVSKTTVDITDDGLLQLQLYLDRSSLELFADNGRVVMSNRIYPSQTSLGVDLFARKGSVTLTSLDVWNLKSIW